MYSQTLGNGQDHLPMRDGKADVFGNVDGCQYGPFLVAGWAGAALFTRVGHKHLMFAVRAAHSCKTLLEIAAFEKGCHRAIDGGAPVAVLGGVPDGDSGKVYI